MNNIILKLEPYLKEGRRVFTLQEDYAHPMYPDIQIPKGFRTDLGSIPKLFNWYVTPSEIAEAAIIHDYLYQYGIGKRTDADKIFYNLVKERMRKTKAFMVYLSVATWGWRFFGKNTFK